MASASRGLGPPERERRPGGGGAQRNAETWKRDLKDRSFSTARQLAARHLQRRFAVSVWVALVIVDNPGIVERVER